MCLLQAVEAFLCLPLRIIVKIAIKVGKNQTLNQEEILKYDDGFIDEGLRKTTIN